MMIASIIETTNLNTRKNTMITHLVVEVDESDCDGDFPDLLGDPLDDICRLSQAELKACNGLMELAYSYGLDYSEDLFYIEEFDGAARKSKFTFFPVSRKSVCRV